MPVERRSRTLSALAGCCGETAQAYRVEVAAELSISDPQSLQFAQALSTDQMDARHVQATGDRMMLQVEGCVTESQVEQRANRVADLLTNQTPNAFMVTRVDAIGAPEQGTASTTETQSREHPGDGDLEPDELAAKRIWPVVAILGGMTVAITVLVKGNSRGRTRGLSASAKRHAELAREEAEAAREDAFEALQAWSRGDCKTATSKMILAEKGMARANTNDGFTAETIREVPKARQKVTEARAKITKSCRVGG